MDMPGTALSLGSMVLGLLQGQIGSLLHKWLDYKYKVKALKADTYLKDVNIARNVSNKRFQVTRRIIFIMVALTFCSLHILPGYTGIPVYTFYTESNGFLALPFYGDTSIKVESLRGFIITPALNYFLGAMAGCIVGQKMSGEKSNIEIILDHLIEQQDKNNNNLNSRLDRLTEMLDKLQSHHIIVPQLENKILTIEKNYIELKDSLQRLIYESDKREDIKKSITNPLIMRTIWSSMGIVACCLCVAVGFSYKSIDIKSNVERQKLMGR